MDLAACLKVQLDENGSGAKLEVKTEPLANNDSSQDNCNGAGSTEEKEKSSKEDTISNEKDNKDKIKMEPRAFKPTEELLGMLLGQAMNMKYKKTRKSVPTSNMRVPCTVCGDMLHPSSLKRHLRLHTDEKPYGCTICDKRFRDSSGLRFHEKVHSDDRAFQCEQCIKSFVRLNEYKRHKKRIHDDIKDRVCETCGQAFMMDSNLKKHMYLDHGLGMKYDCERCGNPFYTPNGLKRHSMICADKTEAVYQCTECGKTYPSKSKLEAHEVAHTGVRNFKCKECDKTFLHAGSLINHTKSAHLSVSFSSHTQIPLPPLPHHLPHHLPHMPTLPPYHPFPPYYLNRN